HDAWPTDAIERIGDQGATGDLHDACGNLALDAGQHLIGAQLFQLGRQFHATDDVNGAKAEMLAEADDHAAQGAAGAGLQEPAAGWGGVGISRSCNTSRGSPNRSKTTAFMTTLYVI